MRKQEKPARKAGKMLLFACSGASDVGELADLAARRLYREGLVQMSCVTAIGGRVESLLNKAKRSSQIIALEGCETDCVSNTLKQAGFKGFTRLRLNDIGLMKGGAPVVDEAIEKVVQYARKSLKGNKQ
ncbi:MAG: zinc-binding protein [candidate division Zixibacteria bacterium]|nr:zinc-binding protein [candidate division Zixibacteria bacterium]